MDINNLEFNKSLICEMYKFLNDLEWDAKLKCKYCDNHYSDGHTPNCTFKPIIEQSRLFNRLCIKEEFKGILK